VKGLRMGIPRPSLFEGVHEEARKSFDEAVKVFRKLGLKIREIDIPNMREAEAAQRIIRISEASAYHETFLKNQPDRYGPSNVRRDVEAGSLIRRPSISEPSELGSRSSVRWRRSWTSLTCSLSRQSPSPPVSPSEGDI